MSEQKSALQNQIEWYNDVERQLSDALAAPNQSRAEMYSKVLETIRQSKAKLVAQIESGNQ